MAQSVSPLTEWWRPPVGLTWQWQLSEPPVDTSIDADVYDIDIFDNDVSVVADLHAKGRKVIGYINVGSWEDWRSDRDRFPLEVLGKDYEGWPGERWLDIRRLDLLAPIMRARMDLCKVKGFDAVEPDNMDIHGVDLGFPITYQDQLNYVLWLADEAHQRGLAIGIKNAADQLPDLIDHFDFAIIEDYFFYDMAERMLPLVKAGKPVFAAEYDDTGVDFAAACREARKLGFNVIQKHRILTSFRVACE
jgi:endo-alpha-1,4-polygalactosaminidase (GH114 family)